MPRPPAQLRFACWLCALESPYNWKGTTAGDRSRLPAPPRTPPRARAAYATVAAPTRPTIAHASRRQRGYEPLARGRPASVFLEEAYLLSTVGEGGAAIEPQPALPYTWDPYG